jgi:hypothetical protein
MTPDTLALAAVGSHYFMFVVKVDQGFKVGPYLKNNIAATAAVSAIGTTLGYVFLPPERNRTRTPVSGRDGDPGFIDKALHGSGFYDGNSFFPFFEVKKNFAADLGKKCIILAPADIVTGMHHGSPLPDKDLSGFDILAAETFYTQSLGMGITTVSGASAPFFCSHKSSTSLALYIHIDEIRILPAQSQQPADQEIGYAPFPVPVSGFPSARPGPEPEPPPFGSFPFKTRIGPASEGFGSGPDKNRNGRADDIVTQTAETRMAFGIATGQAAVFIDNNPDRYQFQAPVMSPTFSRVYCCL